MLGFPLVCRATRSPSGGASVFTRLPTLAAGLVLALALLVLPLGLRYGEERSTTLHAAGGELLGAAVSPGGYWKFAPGAELPEKFITALLAYEDRRFYSHPGFDVRALIRALVQNAGAGRVVSGGSTLSMQAARLGLPPGRRRLGRKLLELVLALRLEVVHGKEGLLSLYAAEAPFGGNVIGLEAASFRYFGRDPGLLSWAESATLAVLPNAPSLAHPGRNRALLLEKRNRLLRVMRSREVLGEEELELALAEPLPPEPYAMPRLAPQLLDRARSEGLAGRRVETSLDAGLQERAAALVEARRRTLALSEVHNAACLVARVDTGEVLAYVGNAGMVSRDGNAASVDMASARRSSGSLLKPFLYAAALDSGLITPRLLMADIPTRVGSYSPENNTRTYAGAAPAEEALARSLNVPFVRLLREYGVERFRRLLVSTGASTFERGAGDYGLTLILGGAETTLWEIAGRYAALMRTARGLFPEEGGQVFDLGYRGGTERKARPDPFSRGAAWLTLEALIEVGRPGEEGAWREFSSSRKIAWKTGTSYGFRDAWAVGLSADYVVAVWVGNATGEGRPEIRGSSAAAPLLFDVFAALPRSAWLARPEASLEAVELCADSGHPAGRFCERRRRVYLPEGRPRPSACPYCRPVQLSLDGRFRVSPETESPGLIRTENRFILPPAMEWYYRRQRIEYKALPPWKSGSEARSDGAGRPFELLSPEPGAALYLPIELSGRSGAAVFTALHRDAEILVFWHLDGSYLGATRGEHRMELRPGPGEHALSLVDEAGREIQRRFSVLSERRDGER